MIKYKEQLKDQRWIKLRNKIIKRDNICQNCGTNKKLNIHHIKYEYGLMAWEYPDEYLICLCEKCHNLEHFNMIKLTNIIAEMRLSGMFSIDIINMIKK